MAVEAEGKRILSGAGRSEDRTAPLDWARGAALAVLAAGMIMLFGVVVDLGVLWLLQREPSPQWEFTAITNTVESVPRLVFAVGFLFIGFHLRRTVGLGWYRALSVILILVGLFSIMLAGLLTLSYFALGKLVTQPEVYAMLRSVAVKTIGLSAVYALIAIPSGVLALRRPRR